MNRTSAWAAWLSVCVGIGLLPARAPAQGQLPPVPAPAPAPAATLPRTAISIETGTASQVFPDGGFPEFKPAAEGGLPGILQPDAGPLYPLLAPVATDYGPGYYPGTFQDAPGALEYRPETGVTPLYYAQPGYNAQAAYATQLRTVEIYAPAGYEARDQQWGPGTAEFTPITAPVPVTPEERERFVVRGLVPGSFLVPGTNTSFRMRGFVRLMGLYDFDPIGSTDSFVPNTIPVPQQAGQNFNMAARMSRIAFESWTPTSFFEWNVHTFIEGDFFNGLPQAAGGGGNPFRLRHAFIDFGYFRVGQQNTVFMDASTWPSVVDFQGPAGWVNQRQPSARVTLPVADRCYWAGEIARPFSDISTNGQGNAVQDVPDFSTHFRYEADQGHVQVAGLCRTIGYRPTDGEVTRRVGYGMSTGTTFHPWAILLGSNPVRKSNPTGLERCRLIGLYTFGWGIGRYFQDTAGLGIDGQVDPVTGGFDLPYTTGFVASYEHWYSEKWLSAVTYSQVNAATNAGQPGSTYTNGKYFTTNLWYVPVRNFSMGVEYIYGERTNLDEDGARARRVNALVQYNF
jgi:hypothetical protein